MVQRLLLGILRSTSHRSPLSALRLTQLAAAPPPSQQLLPLCTSAAASESSSTTTLSSSTLSSSSRCASLSLLSAAADMGRNVVQTPAEARRAEPSELEALLPFAAGISEARGGRSLLSIGLRVEYVQQAEPHPASRPPTDSFISITYPFTSNAALCQQYQRFSSPFLRFGLVLEDLDSFAADVAARHLGGLPPGFTVVTAAIDKLALTTAGAGAGGGEGGSGGAQEDPEQQQQQQLPKGWGASSGGSSSRPEDEQAVLRQLAAAPLRHSASLLTRGLQDVTQYPMSLQQDLRMAGHVCWAGRSSMEVLVELSTAAPAAAGAGQQPGQQQQQDSAREWTPRAVAHFVMVLSRMDAAAAGGAAAGAAAAASGPAWGVPAVVPGSQLEQQHFDTAAARAASHRARRANPRQLSGQEPGGAEVHLLYELAERQLQRQLQRSAAQEQGAFGAGAGAPGGSSGINGSSMEQQQQAPVPMAETSQGHLAVMHSQDRNTANKIFGGTLLRLAAELAYSTAVLHAGRHCEAVALSDVSFRHPVPIGCVLSFRAKVVHTAGPLLRVAVVATKHQQLLEVPSALQQCVTNDFSFTFCATGAHPLRPVEPESLREAVQYLAAHRQHLADGYQAPPALLQPGIEHVLAGGAVP